MSNVNESKQHAAYDLLAERYYDKYQEKMDALESSPLAKVRGISTYDYYAVGKQLESWEDTLEMAEACCSLGALGPIPQIAIDTIVATYGASVIPMIASVQPLGEEAGMIYYKQVVAKDTKGFFDTGLDINSGDVFTNSAGAGTKFQQSYASSLVEGEDLGAVAPTVATLTALPVRPGTVQLVDSTDPSVFAKDDGEGNILGVGIYGSIDYETGAIEVDGASAGNIIAEYQQDFECAADIPEISSVFTSKMVRAKVYALKGCIGMLQSFAMRKRFGKIGEEELEKTLIGEINKEIGGEIIRKLRAAALNNNTTQVTFTTTAPAGVAEYHHRMSFKYALVGTQTQLTTVTGGHAVGNIIIAGNQVAEYLSTLEGFTSGFNGGGLGMYYFGDLDGTPIVRVASPYVLPADEALVAYRGDSSWDSAAIYAPWMPLTTTGLLPEAPNPLSNMNAAVTVAAVDVPVADYVVSFKIQP